MKTILFAPFISIVLILMGQQNMHAQCEEGKSSECIKTIGDFIFLKKYDIKGGKKNVEYSYVLTKGTSYIINLCSDDCYSNDMIVSIYDRERNLLSTNTNKNKLVNSIRLDCNASGIYYMRYESKKQTKLCGESVLAFKRNQLSPIGFENTAKN